MRGGRAVGFSPDAPTASLQSSEHDRAGGRRCMGILANRHEAVAALHLCRPSGYADYWPPPDKISLLRAQSIGSAVGIIATALGPPPTDGCGGSAPRSLPLLGRSSRSPVVNTRRIRVCATMTLSPTVVLASSPFVESFLAARETPARGWAIMPTSSPPTPSNSRPWASKSA
jgi:hypothetical protein